MRDEAHVTLEAERHTLIESPQGDRLELWDTPGFGDSVRLAKRLAQAGNPIGWFMTEVWDRYRDRAFWSSQRAVRNVLEEADVVLYLVNASEAPDDAGYLDAELKVLALIGKPVIVLLNQLGEPQSPADEADERLRWRERTNAAGCVREVLALDAFARCWVQEGTLLRAVAAVLPAHAARARSSACAAAWQRTQSRDLACVDGGAGRPPGARRARPRNRAAARAGSASCEEMGAALGLRRDGAETPREQAMRRAGRAARRRHPQLDRPADPPARPRRPRHRRGADAAGRALCGAGSR